MLLVDRTRQRSRALARALEDSGHLVSTAGDPSGLGAAVRSLDPDVIVIGLDSPDRDTLEDMRRLGAERPRPIVMFVDESDRESTRSAVQAGVAAYVVKGASPERIEPLLELAIARFEELQALRSELARVKTTLAERKTVERAKGILMARQGLSEDEAYKTLRRMAMNRSVRLVEIAQNVIDVSDLL